MESQESTAKYQPRPQFTVVNVNVTDPQTDAVKGFYTYLVSGSDHLGSFEIRRRYNDFFYLRESLVRKWPGLYIPPIPEKKIAGNKDVENIQTRKKFFDFFMKRLGKIEYLFKCTSTQQFLRNKGLDFEKYFSTLPTPKYSDLVADYKSTFSNINYAVQNTGEIKSNIANFSGFLKKAEKELQGLRDNVWNIVEARAGFTTHLNLCNSAMLPEYEKNVYVQYLPEKEKKEPNLIFVNDGAVLKNVEALKDATVVNSFTPCLDLISYEILEVKAMEEALRVKERYEMDKKDKEEQLLKCQAELAKLKGGKTTFKSIFSRGSKNEQIVKLELQQPTLEDEITSLTEFNNICAIIFGVEQLPIFKRQKQLQYYQMMYEVSENELKYLATYGQFMRSVMQGLNR